MNTFHPADTLHELPRNLAHVRARIAVLQAITSTPLPPSGAHDELRSLMSQWVALRQLANAPATRRV